MATTTNNIESEVQSWLEVILQNESLKAFSVTILGNSEKGDGYMGDIVFVTVNGIKEDGSRECYNMVLKCSKRSQVLRDTVPINAAFLNEIALYQQVLPPFIQFQQEQGVKDPFISIPKCYGSFTGENMEVIALENLKSIGYELWPKRQPLTRKHIDMVVTEYGKLHATSVALQRKQPEEFQKLADAMIDFPQDSNRMASTLVIFAKPIEESFELLKNDLDEDTLRRWIAVKDQVVEILTLPNIVPDLKVIGHGDCWNNNFMFFHKEGEEKIPLKVAFLDWQISRYTSPIIDLSYFLMACSSELELQNLNKVLSTYHNSFVNHLKELDIKDPETIYPFDEFLADWKKYSKYGILMASLLMKIVSTEKDEVLDIGQMADSGKDFADTFTNEIRDKNNYKNRIRPIIEYAVKNNLI